MARICHICNTPQIPKYLKIGNFVEISKHENQNLQQIVHLTRPRSFIKTIVHVRTRARTSLARATARWTDHGYEGSRLKER